jgi:aminopeptidase-like protein
MEIKKIIEESYLLNRVFVSDDLIKALDNLAAHTDAPYKDFTFKSGQEFNGWVVPDNWKVVEAKIFGDGKVVYDGQDHPLGVMANSSSFEGKISRKELLKHIHTAPNRPKAIPFHFRLQYRPWDKDWGFCMPQEKYDLLDFDEYEIKLKTILRPGKMISREFMIEGESKETIIFVAHVDHPGLTNDDLSGCAVGIELLNRIKKLLPKPKYTYKLLLTQEILGSVFYLNKLGSSKRKNIKCGIFLDCLGNNNSLCLQKSFLGNTFIDKVCELAMNEIYEKPRIYKFRESDGNDEIVFEAPGIEIPMVSISRFPYPEYHTSDENMDLIKEEKLQETVSFLFRIVSNAEKNFSGKNYYVKRNFAGLISLANPKYDLYIDPGQIIDADNKKNEKKALFQYLMPRYLEGNHSVLDLANEFNIDFNWLVDYFNKMESKGLIKKLPKK